MLELTKIDMQYQLRPKQINPRIYLLMQEVGNYRDKFFSRNQDRKGVYCQNCFTELQRQVSICSHCLTFLCSSCGKSHTCNTDIKNSDESSQRKIQKLMPIKNSRQSFQLVPVETSQMSRGDGNAQKSVRVNCDRCTYKIANKQCLTCKIQNYCISCFRQVHSSGKMAAHESVDLLTTDSPGKRSILTSITSQFQYKRVDFSKISFERNSQTPTSLVKIDGLSEQQKKFVKQRVQIVNKNAVFLSSMKKQLQMEWKYIQNCNSQFLSIFGREFDKLIEEIRLKSVQFQLKIKQKMKNSIDQCAQFLKEIQNCELINQQMLLILENKNNVTSWQQKIDAKFNSRNEILRKLSKREEGIKSREQNLRISDQFYVEAELVFDRIKKIDLKKMIHSEQLAKSQVISNVTPRKSHGEVKSKYEAKSCKNANSINSCKSMDKIDPISLFLTPPESRSSVNRSRKSSKIIEEKEHLSQTVHCGSAVSQTEEVNLRLSNIEGEKSDMQSSLKLKNNPESRKETRTKATVQKTTRQAPKNGLVRHKDKIDKSGVTKAIQNIEKTKKLIKDMRTQMSEFNHRLGDNASNTNDRLQTNKKEEESENMSVSQISIQSLVFDKRK